jgi:catechol 2,3-dioxygenase-like lactoylglutathione lyase family enzyme
MAATLNVVGIVVKDMSRALAFYRMLGMNIPSEADSQPHVEYQVSDGLKLAWDTVETIRSFDPEWAPPSGGSRVGLAFQVSSPAEVDELYKKLVDSGFEGHKEPWDAFWGQRYSLVHDPDGNGIDLYAPLG